MDGLPRFEARRPALVELAPGGGDEAPLRVVIETVQTDRLVVATADELRVPAPFATGTEVVVTYLDRYGVYTMQGPVVRRGDTTLVVGLPESAERVQRRQYVRVQAPLPASCLLLDQRTNHFTPFEARVEDVGGGGLAMTADLIAPPGAVIVSSLALPGEPPVVAVGTVLAADTGPRRSVGEHYQVRVQFSLIAEPDRDRILRFILSSLRKAERS